MLSKWSHLKEEALALRRSGMSMTIIEKRLGIARSTLSGWFKEVQLTEVQRTRLMKNSQDGWKKARERAVESHRAQKALRLLEAKTQAQKTLDKLEVTDELLDLAFAMLYYGEGAKSGTTSIASSDPKILKFVLYVLARNYAVMPEMIRCDLHLRMDQDAEALKKYWASQLRLPVGCFKYAAFDKRSEGKPTYERYMGVCVVTCHQVAIQRKIMYLYTLFCEKIEQLSLGV